MARYIDADLLIEELKELQGLHSPSMSKIANEAIDLGLTLAMRKTRRAHNADVVEVKQGEWLKNNTECSVCKKLNPTMYLNEYELEYYARPLPHCPFCCAKMYGGNT